MAPESVGLPDQACHEDDMASNRKRVRSGSLELPVAKRARPIVEEIGNPSTSPLQLEVARLSITSSTIRNLSRLTEFLALSPLQKCTTPRYGASKAPIASPISIHTSDARDHLESSIVSTKPQAKDPGDTLNPDTKSLRVTTSEIPSYPLAPGASMTETSAGNVMVGDGGFVDPQLAVESAMGPILEEEEVDPSIIEEVLKVYEPRRIPIPPSPLPKDQFHFLSVDPELLTSELDTKTYNCYGLDLLGSSPAKSLSSLAGSDSDSGEATDKTLEKITNPVPKRLQHLNDPEFNPQFSSTQKPGLEYNLASNMGLSGHTTLDNLTWGNDKLTSTSQLQAEVNGQVDEFDKFMEADLSYDQVVSGF